MPRRTPPDIVKSYCEGYRVTFEGLYQGKHVYSVRLPKVEGDGPEPVAYIGYPCYVLWNPEEPKGIEQVSDVDFAITDCIQEQKREKRLQSKLRRQQRLQEQEQAKQPEQAD